MPDSTRDLAPARAPAESGPSVFVTTRWSVVLSAKGAATPAGQAALETLCRIYWPPIYAYLRRCGHSPHDAQDLAQGFFAQLLRREAVAGVSPDKGRFRSFLLASLGHFVSDQRDRTNALKRGAGRIFPMDTGTAESLHAACPDLTPERAFDRQWALTLLERVHEKLREENATAGKAAHFETLRFALAGSRGDVPYRDLASRLGMSEGAVKVAVHRLRQRYREILRETVADTVAAGSDVERELRDLFSALAGS
jgi:RNA polymerase sigma-70 factor (ECF subfamily)